jgi:hypothetical protein
MTRIRSLAQAFAALSAVALMGVAPARALETLESLDGTAVVYDGQSLAQDEPDGESVGEPADEDAPVEGEPGPGDAVAVPPDDPAGQAVAPPASGEYGGAGAAPSEPPPLNGADGGASPE